MLLKPNKKKSPSDYPLYSFRVKENDKTLLNKKIERVLKQLNKKLKSDDKVIRKNDVIVEALTIGLNQLLKKNK